MLEPVWIGITTIPFLLGMLPLVLDSASHGRPSGTRRLSRADWSGRFRKHLTELLQAIGYVTAGVAEPLAHDQQVSPGGDATRVLCRQPP